VGPREAGPAVGPRREVDMPCAARSGAARVMRGGADIQGVSATVTARAPRERPLSIKQGALGRCEVGRGEGIFIPLGLIAIFERESRKRQEKEV
jgi:hypothetical protein